MKRSKAKVKKSVVEQVQAKAEELGAEAQASLDAAASAVRSVLPSAEAMDFALAAAGATAYVVGGTVLGAASLVAAAKATSVAVVVGSVAAMALGGVAVVVAVARSADGSLAG